MENIFQQTSTNYDILTNLSPLLSSPFEPATIKRAISPPPSHLYFLKNWRKKKKKEKDIKARFDLRRVEIARCSVERFTMSAAEKSIPGSWPRGQWRLTAYYRAQPIYRAPVSDRDLFEGDPPPCSSPRDGNHPRRGIHFKGRKFRRRKRSLRLYPRKGWAVIKGRFRPRGCSSRPVPMP